MASNKENFVKGLRTQVNAVAKAVERSLIRVGISIQIVGVPITPVATGNLRRSWYVRREGGSGFTTQVRVGNTAAYAIYVHERLDLKHRSPTQAKFIDAAVQKIRQQNLPFSIMREELAKARL